MINAAASHWSVVDGVKMHALRWPSLATPANATAANATPIVLVHGLGVSSRYMAPTGTRLAPRFTVWAPDLPGFGRSDKPAHVYSLMEHARALECWLAGAGVSQPLLVGHSYGCQVIAELLAREPDLACAVVLAAPTVEAGRRGIVGEMIRLVRDIPRERPALIPVVFGDYLRAGVGRIYTTLRGALADRIENKVGLVDVPTLLVRGEHDPLVSDRWITLLAAKMHDSLTATVAGGGHAVNFSEAEQFAQLVATMAERVRT